MRRWRRLIAAATAGALSLISAPEVGAQTTIDQWYLTAKGSAQVVLTVNHFMIYRQTCAGCGWHVVDHFFPWFCTVGPIFPGNGGGAPLRVWIVAPAGYPYGCLSNGWSDYYGWSTGQGWYEGYNHADPWLVQQNPIQIPFRNGLNAWATEIVVQ